MQNLILLCDSHSHTIVTALIERESTIFTVGGLPITSDSLRYSACHFTLPTPGALSKYRTEQCALTNKTMTVESTMRALSLCCRCYSQAASNNQRFEPRYHPVHVILQCPTSLHWAIPSLECTRHPHDLAAGVDVCYALATYLLFLGWSVASVMIPLVIISGYAHK